MSLLTRACAGPFLVIYKGDDPLCDTCQGEGEGTDVQMRALTTLFILVNAPSLINAPPTFYGGGGGMPNAIKIGLKLSKYVYIILPIFFHVNVRHAPE